MSDYAAKNALSYDSHAEEWESTIPVNLAHKYMEKPAMVTLLPKDLHRKSALCVGVGSGEELDSLFDRGAENVTAIDISNELLKRAAIKFPTVKYHKMDMMNLSFADESFDLIYSSLAFHYSDDWDQLLSGLYRVLKKDGILLFSTHRPEFWEKKKKTGDIATNKRGVTLVGHRDILPGNVEIFFYNHTDTNAVLESITNAGFTIQSISSPSMIKPDSADIFDHEHYDALNQKNLENPLFLVILASK